ncbi:MAG: RDD family protein, partial [Candidatus Thorarchaeota archaeon]
MAEKEAKPQKAKAEIDSPEPLPAQVPSGLAIPILPNGYRIAELWERIFAFLIDIIVIITCLVLIWGVFNPPPLVAGRIALIAIILIYFTIQEAFTGQSLGKRVIGLKVLSYDRETGETFSCTLTESLLRNALRVVELLLGPLTPLIAIYFSPLDERIGDRVAGTIVVQASG